MLSHQAFPMPMPRPQPMDDQVTTGTGMLAAGGVMEPIQLFWRQNDGGHRLLGELIPGALHHESARLGHEFVVRSKSKTGTHFERKWIATVLPADFVGGPPVDNHHLVRVSDAPDEL